MLVEDIAALADIFATVMAVYCLTALARVATRPRSSLAVFGLAAVDMAVLQGAVLKGASRMIGIDINPNNFPLAKSLGATECVNPKDHAQPTHEGLVEMTNGCLDYTFEAVGNVDLVRSALKVWGSAR